jgi:hypothetical protein
MGRKTVTNFGVPTDMANLADYMLRELPGMGWSSRTDVVKQAMRELYLRLVEDQVLPPNAFVNGFGRRRKTLEP